ncbi:Hpt domain-containing protein [Horticoccus luteus]|uniref:Hpt domain-containing protein n=1 Tax=Horticoccus luteus TaxID=2862869 RepID=A0A8F9TSV0_9BACT|nr:Hpt domain-containing protein [Horticoccus luteus]QYM77668.1 Hpt domain-containing protein [Horticoccus luteus]
MDTTVIDPEAIAGLRALNPDDNDEFLREIVGIFLEDTPARIAELDQSLADADTPRFVRAAHSIKGSSANLGATQLRHAAEQLERHGRDRGLADTAPLITSIKSEFARARQELAALVGSA